MTQVAVYNAGGEQLLHTVDLHHAIRMLIRRVARVRESVVGETFGPYPRPRSLELVRWIFTGWLYHDRGERMPQASRENVLRRDRYTCAYCGRTGTTYDHVVPRQLGGQTTWLNCVAACEDCNSRRKGGRTLAQAGMTLQFLPFVPEAWELLPRRR